MHRDLRKLVLWLCCFGAVLIVAGLPIAASHREHRLYGFSFDDCGPGQLGVRRVSIDKDPEHDLLRIYTSYECGADPVKLWSK